MSSSGFKGIEKDRDHMSVEFHDVRFQVGDYDLLEVDFALLPASSSQLLHTSTGAVEQTIRCELLDFISAYPCVTIHAQLLSHEDDLDGARPIEHNCKITLPIGITTFLKPLPLVNQHHLRTESDVFEELWARHTIQPTTVVMRHRMESPLREPGRSQSPDRYSSPRAPAGSYPGSPTPMMSFATTPWDAVASSSVMMAIVSMGGAFQYFQLAGGSLGLGAELPAHGCVSGSHTVLVRVSLAMGDVPENACKPQVQSASVWEIAAVSVDKFLAQAAVASVATQLKCIPTEVLGLSSPRSHTGMGIHQQAGG